MKAPAPFKGVFAKGKDSSECCLEHAASAPTTGAQGLYPAAMIGTGRHNGQVGGGPEACRTAMAGRHGSVSRGRGESRALEIC
ncbi:MAG: hypothetical protein NZ533_07465 [Casimicrobiaceae bacterium]|nr:hypothetical protein [Casimicrobiaceae bacterium]MDW8312628.1 hypothetical protein [Burkholderiales bacterium]